MLTQVETKSAPAAIGPYSQAIIAGDLIYTSGQIPLTVSGELVTGSITEQTHQVFQNLIAILEAVEANLDQVIKTTVFLADMNHFGEMNQVYETFFQNHRPARSCVEVARLPKDVLVEIEVIAHKK